MLLDIFLNDVVFFILPARVWSFDKLRMTDRFFEDFPDYVLVSSG